MTTRNPLVLIPGGNPQIQELPAGDILGGAAQGPVGMTWQGAWSSGTSYAIDDVVSDNGSAYIAIAANTNHEPPNATYWNLLASKGDTGATGATGATGPSGGDYIKISRIVTASSQSTIAFSTIASTYQSLKIILSGRDTKTTSDDINFSLLLNSDTTSGNYSVTTQIGGRAGSATVNTIASSSAGGVVGMIPGSLSVAAAVGSAEITIANYKDTTFHKTVQSVAYERYGTGSSVFVVVRAFTWLSTAAITGVTLTAGGTAFVDGTTATLYGLG